MDFMSKKELIRIQCLQKFMYDKVVPKYFGNRDYRQAALAQMKIPEYNTQNALLFF